LVACIFGMFWCIRVLFEIEVEGVHPVVCVMNDINMVFITFKRLVYYIEIVS
jgi:hypothetical protein